MYEIKHIVECLCAGVFICYTSVTGQEGYEKNHYRGSHFYLESWERERVKASLHPSPSCWQKPGKCQLAQGHGKGGGKAWGRHYEAEMAKWSWERGGTSRGLAC